MTSQFVYAAFIAPDADKGGNPATVILDADALSADEKLSMAQAATTKDVVFVLSPTLERANYRFEYFIDNQPALICGHASVAALKCLKEQKSVEDGAYGIELSNGHIVYGALKDDKAYLEQEHPVYEEPALEDITALLMATQTAMTDILPGQMPMLVMASNRSLVVGVKNLDALKRVKPDFDKLKQISESLDVVGILFFSPETVNEENDYSTRVFAPRFGVNEESASGTLAGALGCYVFDLLESEKHKFMVEQGYFMEPAMPSLVNVYMETDERKFGGPRVGGLAKKIA